MTKAQIAYAALTALLMVLGTILLITDVSDQTNFFGGGMIIMSIVGHVLLASMISSDLKE